MLPMTGGGPNLFSLARGLQYLPTPRDAHASLGAGSIRLRIEVAIAVVGAAEGR